MVRTLFVRPMVLLRFVWGRTRCLVSRLKNLEIQISPLRGISFLGQGAALLTLLLLMFSGKGNDAQANEAQANAANLLQMSDIGQFNIASPDLTTVFEILAMFLLVGANYVLWRQRDFDNSVTNDATPGMRAGRLEDDKLNSDFTQKQERASATRFDLERQYQQLADIENRVKRTRIDTELNHRDKEEQLARICHELRTPLNAVIGFSDIMRVEMFGPLGHDKYIEYVEHIGESGQNLLSAVDDMFELSDMSEPMQVGQEPDLQGLIGSAVSEDYPLVKEPELVD